MVTTKTRKPAVRKKPAAKKAAPRKRTSAGSAPPREAKGPGSNGRPGEHVYLAIESIGPGPFNPRKAFPKKELEELAATIKTHGLLQPLIVRPAPGFAGVQRRKKPSYQLVAGERRLRAAKLAKLKAVPAIVRQLTDGQAREIALVENFQREDLNPIERAAGLAAILKAKHAPTQGALAMMLGCTQGHISNQLRLLELPESLQKRIISGEISARHARAIVPYADQPAILEEIEKQIAEELKYGEGFPSVEVFTVGTVPDAVDRTTAQMDGKGYVNQLGRQLPIFEPSDEERAKLGIITIEENGQKEERATNKKLWQKLRDKQINEAAKAKKRAKAGKKAPAKKLTAAEVKLEAARQKELARNKAVADRQWLWEWKTNWLRWEIAQAIPDGEPLAVSLIGLYLLTIPLPRLRADNLVRLLRDRHIKVTGPEWERKLLPALAEIENQEQISILMRQLVQSCFWDFQKHEPVGMMVPNADVAAIADLLSIDLPECWKKNQAGPLSEAYWKHKTTEQLAAIATELKVQLQPGGRQNKADLVAALHRPGVVNRPMPKQIGKIKPPR